MRDTETKKAPESRHRGLITRRKRRGGVCSIEYGLVGRPVQVCTSQMLMGGLSNLGKCRGHLQVGHDLGELIQQLHLQHVIFDHSVPYERD